MKSGTSHWKGPVPLAWGLAGLYQLPTKKKSSCFAFSSCPGNGSDSDKLKSYRNFNNSIKKARQTAASRDGETQRWLCSCRPGALLQRTGRQFEALGTPRDVGDLLPDAQAVELVAGELEGALPIGQVLDPHAVRQSEE
jgi:hypothetical protein